MRWLQRSRCSLYVHSYSWAPGFMQASFRLAEFDKINTSLCCCPFIRKPYITIYSRKRFSKQKPLDLMHPFEEIFAHLGLSIFLLQKVTVREVVISFKRRCITGHCPASSCKTFKSTNFPTEPYLITHTVKIKWDCI